MPAAIQSQKMAVAESLKSQPLGSGENEGGLQSPFNSRPELVIVRVRNLSAQRKRRMFTDYISPFGGGEEYAREMLEKGRTVSLELLQQQAARGRNPSPTEDTLKPINVVLLFNNGGYIIPHTSDSGEVAPWVDVPAGCYDLYMGNYQRMHSEDAGERSAEIERVKTRRRDVCVRHVITGQEEKNPWAFLDWYYEIRKPQPVAIDQERVYAGDLVEI